MNKRFRGWRWVNRYWKLFFTLKKFLLVCFCHSFSGVSGLGSWADGSTAELFRFGGYFLDMKNFF
jgi:hypothetical protein